MIGIIIQARMGSSRLPGKILKPIGSKSLLGHIIYRLGYLKSKADIIVATSINPVDDAVINFCNDQKIAYYRGSEDNVLSRYYECAQAYGFDNVVRLTGDNPFVDIEELDNLINNHIDTKADYSHSFTVLPYGVGSEIFTFNALEKSYVNGYEPNHLEHVNEYILENPDKFSINVFTDIDDAKHHPEVRLTVDTPDDYIKACYIVDNCPNEFVTTEEAIKLCLQYV